MCPQFTKAEHQNIHSLVVYHWIWSTPCQIINVTFNSFIQNDAILDIRSTSKWQNYSNSQPFNLQDPIGNSP